MIIFSLCQYFNNQSSDNYKLFTGDKRLILDDSFVMELPPFHSYISVTKINCRFKKKKKTHKLVYLFSL